MCDEHGYAAAAAAESTAYDDSKRLETTEQDADLLSEYPIGTMSEEQREHMRKIAQDDPSARIYEWRFQKTIPEHERLSGTEVKRLYDATVQATLYHPENVEFKLTGASQFFFDYAQRDVENTSTQIANHLKSVPEFASFAKTHQMFFSKATELPPRSVSISPEKRDFLMSLGMTDKHVKELKVYNHKKFQIAMGRYNAQIATTPKIIRLFQLKKDTLSREELEKLLLSESSRAETPAEYQQRIEYEGKMFDRYDKFMRQHIHELTAYQNP